MQLDIQAVKTLRWERGETQKSLAARAGISEKALNWLEQGKTKARVSTAQKLAEALGVPVGEITTYDEKVA